MKLNKDEKKMFAQSMGFSLTVYALGLGVIFYESGILVREFVRTFA